MNQADEDVGHDFGRAGLDEVAKVVVGEVWLFAEFAHVEGFPGVLLPERVAALTQVVLIIPEQFLQAGPGYVYKLEFAFLGSPGHLAALADVFIAAPRGLHHLVAGTGFLV